MSKLVRLWRRGGQRDALERVLRPAIPALYRLAFRLTGQEADAEDLLQELALRVRERADEIAALDRPDLWLRRVLFRLYLDAQRRRGRQARSASELGDEQVRQAVVDPPDVDAAGPLRRLEQRVLGDRLRHALEALPEDQRLAVILHDVEGHTLAEIAAISEVAVGTVKSRLHRARRQLRVWLDHGTF